MSALDTAVEVVASMSFFELFINGALFALCVAMWLAWFVSAAAGVALVVLVLEDLGRSS